MRIRVSNTARIAFVALILMLITALSPAVPGYANLTNSSFEGGDGNLIVNTSSHTDWANVVSPARGVDTPTGTSDNAFGQGSKENNSTVSVVDGSIPPNKNDLQRFYVASQNIGTGLSQQTFVYLGWTRLVNIGSADIDFELNQHATAGFTAGSTGNVTLNRTVGDVLFLYDFQGSGTPTVSFARWTGSAWSSPITLGGTAEEAAVNSPTIADSLNGDNSLTTGLFGEAAINLNAAGILTPGVCTTFGSAYTKSRSSNSFTAELKDFIAPVPVNITNCGAAVVHKVDVNTGSLVGGAHFIIQPGANGTTTSAMTETSPGVFCQDNLVVGTHTVTETAAPTGYDLPSQVSQTVTVNNNDTCATRLAGTSVDATFLDPPQLGAIQVNKTSTKGGAALAGAVFNITGPNSYSSGPITTTGTGGSVCVGNLPLGVYHVAETAAPIGYQINSTAAQTATLTGDSTCAGTPVTATFSDSPLSNLTLTFHSLAGNGVTNATVVCTGAGTVASTTLQNTESVTTTNVVGTGDLTCSVHVDP